MKLPILSRHVDLKKFLLSNVPWSSRNMTSAKVKLEGVYGMCRRKRRGAAAVEFALVAPVFFMLVFGMIEFGRMVMVQQIITNAAREGARVGVLDPLPGKTTGPDVVAAVNRYLASSNITGATTTVYVAQADAPTTFVVSEPSLAGYGDVVKVTVGVPFGNVSWLATPIFISKTTQLQASSVMRRETVQQ